MSMTDVLVGLQGVMRKVFKDPEMIVSSEMTADDHPKWDSLTHVLLIVEVERFFKLRFKNSEVASFKNVGDLISMIEKKIS